MDKSIDYKRTHAIQPCDLPVCIFVRMTWKTLSDFVNIYNFASRSYVESFQDLHDLCHSLNLELLAYHGLKNFCQYWSFCKLTQKMDKIAFQEDAYRPLIDRIS